MNFRAQPWIGATRLGIMYTGEKVYDYGHDFGEGWDDEFDHIYRMNTKQKGYAEHHLLNV